MTAARELCQGVLKQGYGFCSRKPTKHYVAHDGTCLKHYCAQHAAGKGIMRLLLPRPWEFDRVETYAYPESDWRTA